MHMSWVEDLNEQQKQAVLSDGNLLILAGAGTGKTKTVVSKIGYVVQQNLATPREILSLTFTNKAAKEMLSRLAKNIDISSMEVGTFHSVCAKWLRGFADRTGKLNSNFTIIDQGDSEKLIKDIIKSMPALASIEGDIHKKIKGAISRLKERAVDYMSNNVEGYFIGKEIDIKPIYRSYQEKLFECNMVDFDDLIMHVNYVLEHHEDIRNVVRERFKYVFVDEYQDTSNAQHRFIKLINGDKSFVCCVGDEDQSIYSWRGADVGNIMKFAKTFSNAKIVRLEKNYRSTSCITDVASVLIANNKNRYDKTLVSTLGLGEKVVVTCVNDHRNEGDFIVKEARRLQSEGMNLNDMAVLVRSSFQNRSLEESFNKLSLPYRIIDGIKFYDREEVKDMVCYLRLIYSDADELAFDRIINKPRRGAGIQTISKIKEFSRQNGLSIIAGLRLALQNNIISGMVKVQLVEFLAMLDNWRLYSSREEVSIADVAEKIAQESGYIEMLKVTLEDDESANKLTNLQDLIDSMRDFDSLSDFLEHIVLVNSKDKDANGEAINVLTMHGAKGLEFDLVFCPGWEEGIFPSAKTLDAGNADLLEEERRLAYVAITRARKNLHIMHANARYSYGKSTNNPMSRFLSEIFKAEIGKSIEKTHFGNSEDFFIGRRFDNDGFAGRKESQNGFASAQYSGFSGKRTGSTYVNTRSSVFDRYGDDRSMYKSQDMNNQNVYSNISKSDNRLTNNSDVQSNRLYKTQDDKNELIVIGASVQHETFGVGQVTKIFGRYAEVIFQDALGKKLVDIKFLNIA